MKLDLWHCQRIFWKLTRKELKIEAFSSYVWDPSLSSSFSREICKYQQKDQLDKLYECMIMIMPSRESMNMKRIFHEFMNMNLQIPKSS